LLELLITITIYFIFWHMMLHASIAWGLKLWSCLGYTFNQTWLYDFFSIRLICIIQNVRFLPLYRSNEKVLKNLVFKLIPSLTFADLPFWKLSCPVKWRRPDIRELISECSDTNIDFMLRSLTINNYNEWKTNVFCLHGPLPLPSKEVGHFNCCFFHFYS